MISPAAKLGAGRVGSGDSAGNGLADTCRGKKIGRAQRAYPMAGISSARDGAVAPPRYGGDLWGKLYGPAEGICSVLAGDLPELREDLKAR